MRRLIIEMPRDEIDRIGGGDARFQKIKTSEPILLLRRDTQEMAGIFRIEFKDVDASVNDLLTHDHIIEAQILEKEKDGKYVVFIRGKPRVDSSRSIIGLGGGYLLLPFEIREETIRLTFLGSPNQITEFLGRLGKRDVHFRVILLTNAKFSSDPLSALTKKQKEVLVTAYELGYYDFPRKINSEQLAKKLNLHSSALVEHRRKAERRLITQILRK
jgi:predicted DNA binding protein